MGYGSNFFIWSRKKVVYQGGLLFIYRAISVVIFDISCLNL